MPGVLGDGQACRLGMEDGTIRGAHCHGISYVDASVGSASVPELASAVLAETSILQLSEGQRICIYVQGTEERIVPRFHQAKKHTLVL